MAKKTLYTTAPAKGAKYAEVESHLGKVALATAAIVNLGAGRLTKTGNVSTTKKAIDMPAFRRIVGNTAARTVGARVFGKDGKLTAAGINFLNARTAGEAKGWNTDAESVIAVTAAMKKGGKVELADGVISLNAKVEIG